MRHHPTHWPRRLAFALVAGLLSAPALAADEHPEPGEQKPEFTWEKGPGKMPLGDSIAQLQLQDEEAFLDSPQTIKLLQKLGNPTSGKEVGMVGPVADEEQWLALFEYEASGYVKDDEKDKIDADELLEHIKEGTEESNDFRKEHGSPGLHVVRWLQPPHYDARTHNLEWGILARDDNGGEIVNYQVKVLGREGVMAVTLMDKPERIETSKASFRKVLERFSYQPGKTYAEWRPGDKVAEYGLTALVVGGGAAVAAKLGLFGYIGKLIKPILVGLAAVAATVGRFFKRLFRREDSSNQNGP